MVWVWSMWVVCVRSESRLYPNDLALISSTLRSFTAYDPSQKYSRLRQPDGPSNDRLMIKSKTHAAGPVVVQFDPLLLWSLRLSNAPSRPCLSPALSCSDVVLAFSASRVCAPSFGSTNVPLAVWTWDGKCWIGNRTRRRHRDRLKRQDFWYVLSKRKIF